MLSGHGHVISHWFGPAGSTLLSQRSQVEMIDSHLFLCYQPRHQLGDSETHVCLGGQSTKTFEEQACLVLM